MNVGGWLMWEGWIWNGGFTQQKTIYNSLVSELGDSTASAFRDSVYWNYIREEDFAAMAQQCFNVVRIPINHVLLEDDLTPYVYKPEGWEVLDSVLSWCERYNIYAVLDLHSAPGGQSNLFTADPDFLINLWNGSINQERTVRLWKAIADRYKNRGIIAGYDLLNEPDPPNDTLMLELYERIIDSIRLVDTNHMIILEGSNYASDFSIFTSLPDSNVAFEFHLYTWFVSDIGAEVQNFTNLSQAMNVPVWCGEWGENVYAELDSTLKIFRDPVYGLSSSAFWTWKKALRNSNYPYYIGIDTTAEWNMTIKWIGNNSLPKPTQQQMLLGMSDFIQKMKLSNCVFDNTLSNILNACGSAGMAETGDEKSLKIWPNPASGMVQIQPAWPVAGVEIYSAAGQLMRKVACSTEFSVEGLPPGMYFLCILPKGQQQVKMMKLVIAD